MKRRQLSWLRMGTALRFPRVRKCAHLLGFIAMAALGVSDAAAVTFIVNSPSDVPDATPGDGKCETAKNNGVCTLRAAIQETNALPGADIIVLQANVPYLLTRAGDDMTALNGDLDITDSLDITGGAGTVIDGNGGQTNDRVFEISQCIANLYDSMTQKCTLGQVVVSISSVTIQNGKRSYSSTDTNALGGGIENNGDLTLTNVTITNNSANASTGAGYGGGIYSGGPLKLVNCAVTNNKVTVISGGIATGGGILATGVSTTIMNSTISGNTSRDSGGGVFGAATIIDSTITANTAGNGGGIYGNGLIINSTISGNFANVHGGGIYHSSGTMGLYNATLAGNTANADASGSGFGGGISNASGTVTFQNTIIGNNVDVTLINGQPVAVADDCSGTLSSAGYNIVSDTTGCTVNGGGVTVASPNLGSLADNGGPTRTRALMAGSPAIDAGNPGGCTDNLGAILTRDQRGFPRPYPAGGPCDIGAFELQPVPTPTPSPTATAAATPTATPTPTPTLSTLANISTRLSVQTGDNVLIGGFIVIGTQPKKVIIRALGPSVPVPGALADPSLELYSGSTLLEANDNWVDSPNKQAIIDSTIPPTNNVESAIVRTLPANGSGYTAIVRGVNNGTGIGVIEAYDLDRSVDSKLANISTRGLVQTGDNVLIAGTIILGSSPQKVIVRAIGPSLPIAGNLQNPTLEMRNDNGGLVEANDNWVDSPNKQAIIDSTIPPTNDLESAIVATLPANGASYTAIVRGVNNTTGIAVVEVYALN